MDRTHQLDCRVLYPVISNININIDIISQPGLCSLQIEVNCQKKKKLHCQTVWLPHAQLIDAHDARAATHLGLTCDSEHVATHTGQLFSGIRPRHSLMFAICQRMWQIASFAGSPPQSYLSYRYSHLNHCYTNTLIGRDINLSLSLSSAHHHLGFAFCKYMFVVCKKKRPRSCSLCIFAFIALPSAPRIPLYRYSGRTA